MRKCLAFAFVLVFVGRAAAQEPLVYGEGQAAPGLFVSAWVQGDPVSRLEPGRVYVVEFWASWCAASKRAMPRLSALQRAHAEGLTVLAVSSRDMQGESLDRVSALVSEERDSIAYRVGFDDRRRTARAWLDAFDVRSVPTAFVVDKSGVIAWIGNPLWPPGEMEEATERVLKEGRLTVAEREALRRRHLERRERVAQLQREFEDTDRAAQPARALRLLDALAEVNPDGAMSYAQWKFEILVTTPATIEEGNRLGRELMSGMFKDDAERLKALAWILLNDESVARPDLDLALRAAERAVELTRRTNADALDTLASACFRTGAAGRAVEAQKRAIELTAEEYVRTDMEERLKKYQEARDSDR